MPASAGQSNAARDRLIAALEQMIRTGEPHHSEHDEGEVLQRALDRALRQDDPELEQLAMRAAASIVATVIRPIVTTDQMPPLHIAARVALKLPRPVSYTADIYGSLDGAEPVLLGRIDCGKASFDLSRSLPASARVPGPHHVRVHARIIFEAADGATAPDAEWRTLPELVYAVYDREVDRGDDARLFVYLPRYASAQQLDGRLPQMPFEYWLNILLAQRGGEPLDDLFWSSQFCSERTQEPGTPPSRLDICSVLHFQIGTNVWQLWTRTGRINFTADSVEWLATAPAFEAFRLVQGGSTESSDLSELERFLDEAPEDRPGPDASIAPEDVVITPVAGKRNTVTVAAAFRNKGRTNLYGAYIEIIAGDFDQPNTIRHFVRNIPARGSVRIEVDVAVPKGYGMALFHVIPSLSEYSPWIFPPEQPQSNDLMAYRFINPHRAPPRVIASLKSRLCEAMKCRGY